MKAVEVLLMDNVENLGIVGEVVSAKPGYVRNYLLPRGLATKPTPGNIARLANARADMEEKMRIIRGKLEGLLERLEGHEITLQKSANEQGVLFAGVSQTEIAEALREDGFDIEERAVRMHETIKRLDSYEVSIVLAHDLKTTIKLWVVSDKPTEELDPERDDSGDNETDGDVAELESVPAEESPAST